MNYDNYDTANCVKLANYHDFHEKLLQIIKSNWKRCGNKILGLSDSKVSRVFSGKQKDIEKLIEMAEFMQINIRFSFQA